MSSELGTNESESAEVGSPSEAVERPSLETERLLLRPFCLGDCDDIQRICSDKEVAANTRTIEHPYPEGAAEVWVKQHAEFWAKGKSAIFAICRKGERQVIGAIGLELNPDDHNAELGYWIDKECRGQGYATEASEGLIQFGFERLGLHRIVAHHIARNPASGRVMEKVGMVREGVLRGHFRKWGVFEDVVIYGILKSDLVSR